MLLPSYLDVDLIFVVIAIYLFFLIFIHNLLCYSQPS